MTTVKGCRHQPKCVRGTAGAMVRHHPSKELPRDVYEYGRKVLKVAAGVRGTRDTVFCPHCKHPDGDPASHFSDAGDDDMPVKCNGCGKVYTILKRIIVVEYWVKEES